MGQEWPPGRSHEPTEYLETKAVMSFSQGSQRFQQAFLTVCANYA